MNLPGMIRRCAATALALLAACAQAGVAASPLSLHPDNPHYFLFRGRPAILIGSGEHYGAVLNLDFDYLSYLHELRSKGLNHTRTFSGTYREVPSSFGITGNTLAPGPNRYLAPWARSATPGYFDGGNKFDLDRWDERYFRRLRDFVAEAGRRGIVVEINLFCPLYDEELWQANPMNAGNNVNGVGQCPRDEVYTLKYPDLTAAQKAVAKRIVEALNQFDNVYYELCNEAWIGGVTLAWQNEIVAAIRETESSLPRRHLIALNLAGLKIADPNPAVSIYNFHHAAPAEAAAANYSLNRVVGDNETGFRGRDNLAYRTEAWDCIIAGGALFSSLDYSFTPSHPDGSFQNYQSPGGGNEAFRKQLRVLKDFIHGFDFLRMAPDDTAVRGCAPAGLRVTRVLADRGRAYAIYVRTRTDADRFSVRWTGTVTPDCDDTFTFHTVSNDGVRLWVNGQLLIDNPRDHATVENQGKIALPSGEKATLRMESYQMGSDSLARLLWSGSTRQKTVIPASQLSPPAGQGAGLLAEYFADRRMRRLLLTRHDATIDFDWSRQSPFPASDHPVPVELKVELPAGDYWADWVDPITGKRLRRERLRHSGGGRVLLSPAFTEDVALKITARK
jgi:hypothetical protein